MLLAGMLEAAHTFVRKAAQMAAQEGATGAIALPAAVYSPFQSQLDRWGSCCLCGAYNAIKEGACAPCCTLAPVGVSLHDGVLAKQVLPQLSMVQRPDTSITCESQHTLA